jgi:hypothetical protein
MGFLFNRNGIIGTLSVIASFIVIAAVIFIVGTVLFNALIFIAPAALAVWLIYKGANVLKSLTVNKGATVNNVISEVEPVNGDKHFEEAISSNRVIDVEYIEL